MSWTPRQPDPSTKPPWTRTTVFDAMVLSFPRKSPIHPTPPSPRAQNLRLLFKKTWFTHPRRSAPAHGAAGCSRRQAPHSGCHTAFVGRHAGGTEAELHAAEYPDQHRIVEVAYMPDSKRLSGERTQARAQRDPMTVEDHTTNLALVESVRRQHGGDNCARPLGPTADGLQPPGVNCAACRRTMSEGAHEDGMQTLLAQHRQRLAQSEPEVGGRRIGE